MSGQTYRTVVPKAFWSLAVLIVSAACLGLLFPVHYTYAKKLDVTLKDEEARTQITIYSKVPFRSRFHYFDDKKIIIYLRGAVCDPGAHALKQQTEHIRQVRWSHHDELDAVKLVIEFRQKHPLDMDAFTGQCVRQDAHGLALIIPHNLHPGSCPRLTDSEISRAEPAPGVQPEVHAVREKNQAIAPPVPSEMPLFFVQHPIPQSIQDKMRTSTWRPECPVGLESLAYLTVTFLTLEGTREQGHIIVHEKLANEVLEIFEELLRNNFPIERIRPMYQYGGDDDASMAANNTSGFNCRFSTGSKTKFSLHSYGYALDINPVFNPYVRDTLVLPREGESFLKRSAHRAGMVRPEGICWEAFTSRGWKWGGDWKSLKDYQHFEKKPQ